MNHLSRPWALISGASSGLGRAVALQLADEGWHVILADVDEPGGRETRRMVELRGGSAEFELLDVTDLTAWQTLVARQRVRRDHLDLLVLAAGVVAAGRLQAESLDVWRRLVEVNLFGAVQGAAACHDWLRGDERGGRVIFVSSLAGLVAAPTMGAYSVAKAGIVALAETLRIEWAADRIGVSVVCPGFFPSQLLARGTFDDDYLRTLAVQITDRSTLTADAVAAVALVASRRGTFLTVVGGRARRLVWLARWLPRWFRAEATRRYLRLLLPKLQASDEPRSPGER